MCLAPHSQDIMYTSDLGSISGVGIFRQGSMYTVNTPARESVMITKMSIKELKLCSGGACSS